MFFIKKSAASQKNPKFLFLILLFLMVPLFHSQSCSGSQMVDDTHFQPDMFSIDDLSSRISPPGTDIMVITNAVGLFKQGEFKKAFEYAGTLISRDSENIPGHGIKGVIFAFTAQKEQAQKELKFFEKYPKEIFYPELINAMLSAQKGKIKKAEKHVGACLKEQPDHPVALYYQGSLFLAQEQYKPAITNFETVLSFQPEFVPALAGLGRAWLMLGEMDKALAYYEKAVELEPENLLYRRQLLNVYQESGKTKLANNQIKEMLYYTPGVKQGYLTKGRQLLIMGEYEEAITLMDKILNVYKDVPLALYIKAAAYSNLRQKDKAVENIDSFLENQKNSPLAHHYAGMCYMALDMTKKAEKQFMKVISLNPNMGKSFVSMTIIEQLNSNFIRALEGLNMAEKGGEPIALIDFLSAHIFLQQKNQTAFLEKMENGVKLIPGLKSSNNLSIPEERNIDFFAEKRNLMVLFFYNGWYGKTLEISQNLIKKNPHDRFALYFKALCETAQNKHRDAIQSFNSLLKLEKDLISVHMGLGRLYLKTNDMGNAKIAFKNAVNIDPSYSPAYAALGDVFQMNKNYEEAINNYQKALKISPEKINIYSKLIILLSEKKETQNQMLDYAEKLESFSPEDAYSLDAMGWAFLKNKKSQKGLKLIQKAHKASPKNPLILYHLGIAYYQTDDLKAAQGYLQASVDQSKNFPGYDHAMDILKQIESR